MKESPNEQNHDLWSRLCSCEEKISGLKKEIGEMEGFINTVAGSDVDRAGLEKSLNFGFYKKELERLEMKKGSLAEAVNKAEKAKLGEEIPRSKSGRLQVPWEDLHLAEVQKQIDSIFGSGE